MQLSLLGLYLFTPSCTTCNMTSTFGAVAASLELVERPQVVTAGHAQPSSPSSFRYNRYDARNHLFKSTRYATSPRDQEDGVGYRDSVTLLIIQLLSHHNIKIFPADTQITQYNKELLGVGSTFHVQASSLPIWQARAHTRYRDPTFPRQGEKFHFTDHTQAKWNFTTIGAYKSLVYEADPERDRDRLMRDLLMELRILSHPPLQRHKNIVHVLGFAWIQDNQFLTDVQDRQVGNVGERREWPVVVTPKAQHGSLHAFMRSEMFRIVPVSLRAKLSLCADVLNGLKALHECDIVHGDVKCANVLIYDDSASGTAENWQAKLADFSNSIALNEEEDRGQPFVGSMIRGTEPYNAPEVTDNVEINNFSSLKFADIWSFGLLALEVLLDGDHERRIAAFGDQQHLRFEQRRDILLKHCERHLRVRHSQNHALVQVAMGLAENCLQHDPTARPNATNLLTYLHDKLATPGRHALSPPSQHPQTLTSLDHLPFFNLSDHYYDLVSTLTVPQQIFKELKNLVDNWPLDVEEASARFSNRLHAEFQLGLCYASGFGVDPDYDTAVAHVVKAASYGLPEASVVTPRMYAAFGIPIAESSLPEMCTWLESAWRNGSITAMQDVGQLRERIDSDTVPSQLITFQPRDGHTKSILDLPPLHTAVLAGKIGDCLRREVSSLGVNGIGACGEVALHYTVCLPECVGQSVAMQLLEYGASIFLATSAAITFSDRDFVVNKIDAGTTPLQLAIAHDRIDLLKAFLASCDGPDDTRLWNRFSGILILAVRYSSMRCLRYICTDPTWAPHSKQHVDDFDSHQLSAMYYACRPDLFDRLYRSLPTVDNVRTTITTRNLEVVALLSSMGCSFKIQEGNLFNVFHLLASYGDLHLLERLLSDKRTSSLIEGRTDFGWTPLKEAIARGRYEAFVLLTRYGAALTDIWMASGVHKIHALHVCALSPGSVGVRLAENIIQKNPKSLYARDSTGNTPLHKAASQGRVGLIRLFDKHRAPLYALTNTRLTPLGTAVLFRMTSAVCEFLKICRNRSLPVVSLILYGNICNHLISQRIIHPVEQLVTPGNHPTTRVIGLNPAMKFGACDHPFSEVSLDLLRRLVLTYPTPGKFRINLYQTLLFDPIYTSGIVSAIRMGNVEGVRCILDSLEKTSNLRTAHLRQLLFRALSQLSMDEHHIASEDARLATVEVLWRKYKLTFRTIRERRQSQGKMMPRFWKTYYSLYGDIQHQQLTRAKKWIQDNPLQVFVSYSNGRLPYLVPVDEFVSWHWCRVSPMFLNMLLVVLLEIPAIVCLVLIATDKASSWNATKSAFTAFTCIVTNLLPFWNKAVRVTILYYGCLEKTYQPLSKVRVFLRVMSCVMLLSVTIFNIWILYRGSTLWLPSYNSPADPSLQLARWRQRIVIRFYALCSGLIAWHVIFIGAVIAWWIIPRVNQAITGRKVKKLPQRVDYIPEIRTVVI
ncbi:hypothetical protein CC86DRAFT_59943 [Ophiobolus disseminans]|uniref:Protein kinase domain-containing protein n=1 Tax=Ophiobolus disseminans TaxID=1469910 RepID=A0A6A6ZTW8_9PLEO|nr:hypothetical protein CC86DRAFT_59943 [Ophiobolus disseminans]